MKKRRKKPMAKTRYRTRYKKVYRKARSGGGSFKPIIDGLIVGVASNFLRGKIPYADAITTLGVGYFRNNTTLKTLGAIELGQSLISGFGLGGSNGGQVR
jgi:hypothetical protein